MILRHFIECLSNTMEKGVFIHQLHCLFCFPSLTSASSCFTINPHTVPTLKSQLPALSSRVFLIVSHTRQRSWRWLPAQHFILSSTRLPTVPLGVTRRTKTHIRANGKPHTSVFDTNVNVCNMILWLPQSNCPRPLFVLCL